LEAIRADRSRQTVFLPIIGLVPHEELRPGDLIGVNKDSYLILDKLPAGASGMERQAPSFCLISWRQKITTRTEYDARVKAMEVDERPTETYTDIGGLDKQIEELVEAM
jgi:26S proteasome regulatory subunit T5